MLSICAVRGVSRLAVAAAVVAFAGAAATPALGQSISLGASADNTLFQDTLGALSSGAGQFLYAGTLNSGSIRRGVVRFDVSTVPAGAVITGATLRLHMSRSVSSSEEIGLHRMTRSWGEAGSNSGQSGAGAPAQAGDATWLHAFSGGAAWANAGGDFVSSASATTIVGGEAFYTWSSSDLIADVQSWVNGGGNFGWAVLGNESIGQTVKRFDTRENANASFRPDLTITYVIPAPGTALLAGAGLALVARRRRR